MQSWSRQSTKCLFCQFRQAIVHSPWKPIGQPPRCREFASTSIRHRAGRKEKEQARKAKEKEKEKEQPTEHNFTIRPKSQSASTRGGLGFKRSALRSLEQDPAEKRETIKKFIREALAKLPSNLSPPASTQDGEPHTPSLMERLDPDGTLWPAFHRSILSQIEQATGRGDAENKLWKRLFTARTITKAEVEQEVYFDFLNFAFKSTAVDPMSGTSLPIDLRYPTEWYNSARSQQREIHLHVGPTNSGKTYNALKRLQESKNGFYAGPLRLLAHEVFSRFRANGIPCDLITGDDVRLDDNLETKVYASTVEMVQCGVPVDVAVIDEIQMMGNEERGWAWTRAFLGANAKEVHLCGEARVVPLIRELSASMGDALHIHHYERLNPLRATTKSLRGDLRLLRKGDCIVAFSIMQIHALRKQIEVETGRRCAIVYGSLPPETRAEQADLFNNPDNDYDYLVASDAIGMGLNLSVKRIIFNSVSKFDGTKLVQLTVPQIKQIGGRAGRYRSAHDDKTKSKTPSSSLSEENVGLVTCLDEADLPIIQSALRSEAPPLRRAGILPPAEFLEECSQRLPIPVPFEYLLRRVAANATLHPRFFQCDIRDKLALARITDDVKGLTIEQRVNLTAAPSPGRNANLAKCLKALARAIADQRSIDVADVPEIPFEVLSQTPTADRSYLEALESLHQCLILFLWLSYRFSTNLRDRDMAMHAKSIVEQKINWVLRAFSANPKLRERLRQIRRQQEGLVEGHFSTDTAAEGQAENKVNEAQPDQPAEAYEGEGEDEHEHEQEQEDEASNAPLPQLEDFGDGEDGLDVGHHLEKSQTRGPANSMLGGESMLDIAPTSPSQDDSHLPLFSGSLGNDPLLLPHEEQTLDSHDVEGEKSKGSAGG